MPFTTRRNLLKLGLSGLLSLRPFRSTSASIPVGEAGLVGEAGFDEKRLAALLVDTFHDLEAPRAVGRRYLEIYPEEADQIQLVNAVLGTEVPRDITAFGRMLQNRRREDFRAGDAVIIDGWVLSRTEVRLCALTAVM